MSACGNRFLSLFLSLGRCDEFSLERFLIKPVPGLCVCLAVSHTHTPHTCTDESRSVSNKGISVYNKLVEDPILGTQRKKQM